MFPGNANLPAAAGGRRDANREIGVPRWPALEQFDRQGTRAHAHRDHGDEALRAHANHGEVGGFFVGDE